MGDELFNDGSKCILNLGANRFFMRRSSLMRLENSVLVNPIEILFWSPEHFISFLIIFRKIKL